MLRLVNRVIETIAPARMGRTSGGCWPRRGPRNLGDGIALAAGPLLVASQTHDPFLVALAALLQRLPWLLFGLYAGALADRLDRRLIVFAVDLLPGRWCWSLLAVTIVTGVVSIAVVLGAMFLLGTAEVFADTTTEHAAADAGRQARPRHRQRPDHGRVHHRQPARRAADRRGAVRRWAWRSRSLAQAVCVALGACAGLPDGLPAPRRAPASAPSHVRQDIARGLPLDVAPRRRAHPRPRRS